MTALVFGNLMLARLAASDLGCGIGATADARALRNGPIDVKCQNTDRSF
jgi:hypothetical protein